MGNGVSDATSKATVLVHRRSDSNPDSKAIKVDGNVKITDSNGYVNTNVKDGNVTNKNNNKVMDLGNSSYGLFFGEIIDSPADKKNKTLNVLTEDDLLAFRAKYKTDADYRKAMEKKYGVTGVRQDAQAGVTTIEFTTLNWEYLPQKSTLKFDFETKSERNAK